jgi:two-component system sensor histidine kinase KdpD
MSNLFMDRRRGCVLSLGVVALMSLLGEFVQRYLDPTNLVMLYLLAVIISANLWGRGPSIVTAVVSVLVFDFLFVPPRFTFTVADTQYILTFVGLLIVGIVISELASKMRESAIEARSREAQTTALYNLSKDLAGTLSLEKALQIILFHMKKTLGCDLSIHLQEGEFVRSWSSRPGGPEDEYNKMAVRRVLSGERGRGGKTGQLSEANVCYAPLRTSRKTIGVLSYGLLEKTKELSPEKKKLLDAISNQAALAIERIKLFEENRQIELLHEKEKLQTALLSSISHDLRTPLVSITGSLSSLLQEKKKLNPSIKQELIETAYEESVRMNRLVGHLLDMAQIEAGALKVHLRPCDIREVIGVSLEQLKEKLNDHPVRIEVSKEVSYVPMDFFLMTKVMTNVIDNAAKYSPQHTPINLEARIENARLQIRVGDKGYGIPPEDLERVFNKFFRVERSQNVQGTGLGLSICRGIAELHGGRIWVESLENRGTTVIIEIPLNRSDLKAP